MIRRLLLAWLLTGAIQYTCLPAPERVLSGFSALTGQSFPLLLVGTAASFALLTLAGLLWRTARWERAALLLCFGWQLVLGLCASWSVPLLCAGLVVLALLLVYAAYGARTDAESLTAASACTGRRAGLVIAAAAAAVPEPARKRAIGNGWTASVIAEIFKLLPQAETVAKTDVA